VSLNQRQGAELMAKSAARKPVAGSRKKVPAKSPRGGDAATVDMRGLKCPFPALKTKKILSRMTPGEVLVIECTDPLAAIDIPNLIRETGDTIERSAKKGRVLTFAIRKR
jgi:tRNA 2-thiouridine synthesizing protein A